MEGGTASDIKYALKHLKTKVEPRLAKMARYLRGARHFVNWHGGIL